MTDGFGSTPGADNRYPAERLVAAGRPLGVLNAGISGNLLLTDHPCSGGDRGLARFGHDVLDQPGVRSVIVLQGTNDIGLGGRDIGCAAPPWCRWLSSSTGTGNWSVPRAPAASRSLARR
ncbi:hypothetical protein [Actinomadura sp. HBU206391]|uniref:hypothetical protein n=1 Tax=Actinomadura sp. HBU206391 TaxID=2731692 RepID=UPI00164F7FD3|nr:hypothetical protein [Actinomadura sp. HBU206391]MBC6459374.1 hypothetical protein [Actinomadura sp. HBU206391]